MGNPTKWSEIPHYQIKRGGPTRSDNKGPTGWKLRSGKRHGKARGEQARAAQNRWIWILHAPARWVEKGRRLVDQFNNPVPPI